MNYFIFITFLFSISFAQNLETEVLPFAGGPEDLTIAPKSDLAIVSCDPRRINFNVKESKDKVNGEIWGYFLDANKKFLMTPKLDFPFHPHGISLFKNQLYVINHREDKKTTVERFELKQNKLTFKESISSEGFISPNDLTAFGENQFYYSNDPFHRPKFKLLMSMIFKPKNDKVNLYMNGKDTCVAKLASPNGITIYNNKLFIAELTKKRIAVFEILENKTLKFSKNIKVKGKPDNIEVDEEKNKLYVACHTNFGKFLKHMKNSEKPSPFALIEISDPLGKKPISKVLFKDDGNIFSASSVFARYKNNYIVGGVFDAKLLLLKSK